MSVRRLTLAALGSMGLQGAAIADTAAEALPDAELLEYLGMWENSDDEWLMFEERDGPTAEDADAKDAATAAGGPTEKDDES